MPRHSIPAAEVVDIEDLERATRAARNSHQIDAARQLLYRADRQLLSGALHPIDERLLTIVRDELAEALSAFPDPRRRPATRTLLEGCRPVAVLT